MITYIGKLGDNAHESIVQQSKPYDVEIVHKASGRSNDGLVAVTLHATLGGVAVALDGAAPGTPGPAGCSSSVDGHQL